MKKEIFKLHSPKVGRFLFIVCLTFSALADDLSSIGGGGGGLGSLDRNDGYSFSLCSYPYRKVGDRYCDLNPLFRWIEKGYDHRQRFKSPMPAWQPYTFTVRQVFRDGVLCTAGFPTDLGQTRYFIRNHPRQDKFVDRDYFTSILIKLPERFQYRTAIGSTETVEQYDYGEIFDPQERAKQFAAEKAAAAAQKKP